MIADGEGRPLPGLYEMDRIPPRPDPAFGNQPGPYADSAITDVCGTLSAPHGQFLETGGGKYVLYAGSDELDPAVRNCDGFDARARIVQPPAAEWPLTGIITRIGLAAGGIVDLRPYPGTYIIDYAKLAPGPDGLPRHPWVEDLKAQLPRGSRLLLSFFDYVRSPTAFKLYRLSRETDFWDQGFLRQFDGIVAVNHCALSDIPAPHLLEGERLDQDVLDAVYEANHPPDPSVSIPTMEHTIIPCIAWGWQESSLRRQIELVVSKPEVNTILIDAHGPGLDRTLWTWRWLYALERYAKPHRHIRWIITGISSGWAIQELNAIFPDGNYHLILSLSAYVHAKGASADLRLQEEHLRRAVNRLELLRTGAETVPRKPRPNRWPTFPDCVPRERD